MVLNSLNTLTVPPPCTTNVQNLEILLRVWGANLNNFLIFLTLATLAHFRHSRHFWLRLRRAVTSVSRTSPAPCRTSGR